MPSALPPPSSLDGWAWRDADLGVLKTAQKTTKESSGPTDSIEDSQDNVLGNYTILDCLGTGASSMVHRARRQRDGLHVALKLMKRSTEDLDFLAKQEFEMLRSIDCPNIIKAYDFIPGGFFDSSAVVLELFEGTDLKSALRASGPLSVGIALRLFMHLLQALVYLHARDIIHRDIKAENLLVAHDFSQLKVADFNVSTRLNSGGLTPTGTPAYAAPEVRGGEFPGKPQDVWSAGLCLLLMLHGRLRLDGESVAGLEDRHWPEDREIGMEGLCSVALSRALQVDPNCRATAPALFEELQGQLSLIG